MIVSDSNLKSLRSTNAAELKFYSYTHYLVLTIQSKAEPAVLSSSTACNDEHGRITFYFRAGLFKTQLGLVRVLILVLVLG